MNVYLRDGGKDLLPGDLLVRWVLRSDLTPIPRTLELTVRVKNDIEDRLKKGEFVWTGRELLKYEIIQVRGGGSPGLVQGDSPLAVFTITAVLASCAPVAYRRVRAVIRENANLGDIYRSCGAQIAIGDDFNVRRFCCFAGQVPTFHIARALQEESAVLVLRDERLSIVRLKNLFSQKPVDTIVQHDQSGGVDSEFLERHQIPAFFSTVDDGSFIMGANENARDIHYMPRSDERVLRNSTRVLVTKRVLPSRPAQQIRAGDIVTVNGENLAVITAAHEFVQREGATDSVSKFWLGGVARP